MEMGKYEGVGASAAEEAMVGGTDAARDAAERDRPEGRPGRLARSTALFSIATGLSRIAGANWVRTEQDLASGVSQINSEDPEEYKTVQAFTGISGYAAWALGTAATVAAPFFRGDRSTAVSGGFQKFLYTTGSVLNLLGNLSSFITYNYRLLVDIRSRAYDLADFSTLFRSEATA